MTPRDDMVTLTDAARHEKVSRTAIYARLARRELSSEMHGGVVFVHVKSMTPAARKRYADVQAKKEKAR